MTYSSFIMMLMVFPVLISITSFSYIIKPKDEFGIEIEIIRDYNNRNVKKIILSTILLTIINYFFIEVDVEFQVLIITLYLISVYDLRFKLVPDRVILFIVLLGLINIFSNFSKEILIESILTCLAVFAVFYVMALITKGGIGGADIKIFTSLGLMFSYQEIILIVFLTYLVGLLFVPIHYIVTKSKEIALVPYISLATGITILFGYEILYWYNYGGFNDFITTIVGGL